MKSVNKIKKHDGPVAIIGIGCFFPGSPGLKEYWHMLFHGKDGITDVPETHWSPEDYFDKDPAKPDHVYCKRGGFISPVLFDPTEFGIPPASLEATDSSQVLALIAAKNALEDSGYYGNKIFNRDKTSVILGATGTQELSIPLGSRLGHPKWRKALSDSGIPSDKAEEVIRKISDSFVSWQENSFPGLLGNVIAGRICNRLDLGGTNCVVDAACASSLSAIHLAVMELTTGRSDMVITGGVDALNDIFMHMCFSKTRILSPTGDIRPFSKDADGTVLGEGIGILVLKRLMDAERDGDKIYAVIKGIGTSSDGKAQSIYAPRKEGQVKALNLAYANAQVDPSSIDLIEAHGTGTRVGDLVEFQALTEVFGNPENPEEGMFQKCAIGSVKSMIGHTKAAAGSAGLIKAALSVYHKTLLPTLKADIPDPALNISESPFYLNPSRRPWFSKKEHPRRCGVSSFGFGGSNFHAVLEEYKQSKQEAAWDGSVEIIALSAPTYTELVKRVSDFKYRIEKDFSKDKFAFEASKTRNDFSSEDHHRILFIAERGKRLQDPAFGELPGLLKNSLDIMERNSDKISWNTNNIFYGGPAKNGKIAFVFPGQGSQYVDMGRDIVCIFPEALEAMENANRIFSNKRLLTDYIYPVPAQTDAVKKFQEERLRKTEFAQPAIGAVSMAMLEVLRKFGIKPDASCGHSFGEVTALFAAGWIDSETFIRLSAARGRYMALSSSGNGAMLAVSAPVSALHQIIQDEKVILANINSPDQAVLSGPAESIKKAQLICNDKGLSTRILPVSAAFHTNQVKDAIKPFKRTLKDVCINPTDIPVYSNTMGKPYPADQKTIKKLLGEQLLNQVNFEGEIKNIFDSGVSTFIEIGPRSVLTGLIKSILKGRGFNAVSMDSSSGKNFGLTDLAKVLCNVASTGHYVNLCKWEQPPLKTEKRPMSIPVSGANYRKQKEVNNTTSIYSQKKPPEENQVKREIRSDDPMSKDKISPHNTNKSDFLEHAFKIVEEGLKTMQSLQIQTAETHMKFLETQAEAGRALHKIIESTKHFFGTSSISEKNTTIIGNSDQNHSFDKIDQETSIRLEETVSSKNDAVFRHKGSDIKNALLSTVSHLTGYPIETLGLDMDLEADLGIDSIKRVEIFSSLEEKIPGIPPIPPEAMASLKTLGNIIDYLNEFRLGEIISDKTSTISTEILSRTPISDTLSPENVSIETKHSAKSSLPITRLASELKTDCGSEIQRNIVSIIEKPLLPNNGLFAPSGKIFITDDKSGLSKTIIDELSYLNVGAELVSLNNFINISDLSGIGGLVIIPEKKQNDASLLEDAFLAARHASHSLISSGKRGKAIFATISRLDGAFGFKGHGIECPFQGGLAGLAKTAAVEWPGVICRAIDVEPEWSDNTKIARAVIKELLASEQTGLVETGIGPETRLIPELRPSPYPEGKINLAPEDVVIITGGARGITASAALALAQITNPVIVLLGRSPEPSPEPLWLSALEDETSIKKAVLSNHFSGNNASPKEIETIFRKYMASREISRNLEKLKSECQDIAYYSVDVRDKDAIEGVINQVRSKYGRIKAIIHGAGVLEDRLIIDKTLDQFKRVFDTKVKGLSFLLSATRDEPLQYIVLFSSITARIGNKGQVDYAMGNEVLNKIAQQEAITRPDCRVISINWGPWDGGMVSETLKREFKRNNIDLIPVEKGAKCMLLEMMGDKSNPVEVVIGSNIISKEENHTLSFKREIDVKAYSVLESHIIGGKPVVPFALMAEWLGHGALHVNPGLFLHGLDDIRLLKGITLDKNKKLIRLLTGKPVKKESFFEVNVEIRDGMKDGVEIIHTRAKAILADSIIMNPPAYNIPDKISSKTYKRSMDEVYDKILFHGIELRGIKEIIGYSSKGMVARISPAPHPDKWIKDPLRNRWISDPLALDSAFQMAILWCYEELQQLSLPSYCRNYRQYCSNFPSDGVTAVLEIREALKHKIKCDITFLDAHNIVVAMLNGYEAVISNSLFNSFRPQ
ncbi:MAG: SDR family NAD(P)-dependent oxidoreductase [Proteobacteria bacterium]|nr:SDR family NAD(P)-dependent oxidoreductase [Pseudomonadota bacterium]